MTPVNFIIMSSGDGLSPVRHQSNGALSSFWLLWTNCSQGFIKLYKSDKNKIKLVNFCRFYFKGSLPNQTSVMLWRLSVFHYPQNGHFMHANPVTERLIYNIKYFVILYQNIKHEYDVAVLFSFFFLFFLGGGGGGGGGGGRGVGRLADTIFPLGVIQMIYHYSSGLFHWHWNIVPVPVK